MASPEPLRTVAVVTDSSDASRAAVERTMRLPLDDGARVHLLRVLPTRTGPTSGRERQGWLELDRLAEHAREAAPPGLQIETKLVKGDEAVEAVRHARAAAADLIVCGRDTTGPHVRTRLKMAREAELPLLVVSPPAQQPYRHAMVAVDLSDASRDVAETALRVVGSSAGGLHFVHALHVPFETRLDEGAKRELLARAAERLEHLLASLALGPGGPSVTSRVAVGEAAPVLLLEAERVEADVIAVGTHGRSALGRALHGSVARSVWSASRCDVLVGRPFRVTYELP